MSKFQRMFLKCLVAALVLVTFALTHLAAWWLLVAALIGVYAYGTLRAILEPITTSPVDAEWRKTAAGKFQRLVHGELETTTFGRW